MLKKLSLEERLYFLLLTLLLFMSAGSDFVSITTLSIFSMLLVSIYTYFGQKTKWKERVKWILPVISIPTLYEVIGTVVSAYQLPKWDLYLQKIDQVLVGGNLSLKLQPFIHPMLTETMYIVYLLFFIYVLGTIIHYARRKDQVAKSFYTGIFSIYWIGFLFYVLIPADGPHIDMVAAFDAPIREGLYFSAPICDMILERTNRADVFPSLHCSISAFCLFFDGIYRRRRFYLCLPLCLLIWVSTIYLRYHYFVDVVAGISLTFITLQLAKKAFLKPLSNLV